MCSPLRRLLDPPSLFIRRSHPTTGALVCSMKPDLQHLKAALESAAVTSGLAHMEPNEVAASLVTENQQVIFSLEGQRPFAGCCNS